MKVRPRFDTSTSLVVIINVNGCTHRCYFLLMSVCMCVYVYVSVC
jgi:hypothetical protein